MMVRLERDGEDRLGLQRRSCLYQRSSQADVEEVNWALIREGPREAPHNFETSLGASIGHGLCESVGRKHIRNKTAASSRKPGRDANTNL